VLKIKFIIIIIIIIIINVITEGDICSLFCFEIIFVSLTY